ncbi:hypothetical protein SAMN04487895_101498 [Paenibacillus sophorae]|uniref:Uncharacterized protein n=1 Tax=Paenibacillus sophorae TaxID=1333845 RepID=A0A1H8GGD5_9BACL|nr:hypothetical protein [Paenibacillus sophorae]QWU14209.1 hypothetical protein KP014_20060 [Paenibacillus sophorae]SEN42814.1 hypothetical protein SAMN04487895_101498 [Paenibacillus sophorae]
MNIVELVKTMTDGQTAYSYNLKERIIKKYWGLYIYQGENESNDTILDCNMNYLLEDNWEIDLPYVDFWTAYKVAKEEGWAILSEFNEFPMDIQHSDRDFSQKEIDGRWQILNQ